MSSEILLENEFGYVELYTLSNDIKAIRFVHSSGEGSVSLYGGQVLTWQPKDQQPIFWLSKDSKYSTTAAIRGGIPICWPWFGGKVKSGEGNIEQVSNHGFARQSQWHLDDIEISQSQVIITLSLSGKNFSPLWPAAFKLSQRLVFSAQFQQTLTVTNLSEQSVEYTGALHSYFMVSSPDKSNIPRLESVRFDDKLSGEKSILAKLTNCIGPIDRIYHGNQSQTIIDHGWQREIHVSSDNCQQWVMWNPGKSAQSMSDMHQSSEQEFVCLEAANTTWQPLASHESVTVSQQVSIKNI
jgi:glucose-6-phosphate 1-epimerase